MDAVANQADDVPNARRRPSSRTISLPQGPTAHDRRALIQAIAEALLEIRTWSAPFEVGDWSYLILDMSAGGKPFYAQFLSEPGQPGVLCELASGFYDNESMYRATPEQARAMVSRGFSDGLAGNFRKDVPFDAPDAAAAIAEQTLCLLGDVFGWSHASAITAKLFHSRASATAQVFAGVSRNELRLVLLRHGIEAREVESERSGTRVEAAFGGVLSTLDLFERVEDTARYRLIVARSRVGSRIEPGATNPLNALTWIGRSWVNEGDAYFEATARVAGRTEDALHEWLNAWERALLTARSWYRRVVRCRGETLTLLPSHFTSEFHNVHRIARCHVRPAAEEAAIQAFFDEVNAPLQHPLEEAVDAWAFFERYAGDNPTDAIPIESRFVSRASATDIVPWLERIDGVAPTVTPSGELEIRHVVPGGTLRVAPSAVRRVSLCPERFALTMTIEGADGTFDVQVGVDDFYFVPCEARVEIEGVEHHCAEVPALVTWFETKHRLVTLEREMAWRGVLECGGQIASLRGALRGAERVGLVVAEERQRFERVLDAAGRSWRAASASRA